MSEERKIEPFTRLQTNMKGASPVTLGPNTVVVGLNQRGKTALVDSIQSAILGNHPMVRGGPGVGARWLDLFAPPDQGLEVVLEGPQGAARFRVWKEGKSAKVEHDPGPLTKLDTPIPDLVFAEPLLKEGATMQNELIRRWGEGAAADAPDGATDDMKALWDEVLKEVLDLKKSPSDTELLAEAVSALGRKVKSLGREIGELDRRSESADPSAFAGTELIPQLEAELDSAKRYKASESHRQVIATYEEQTRLLEEAKARHAQLAAELHAKAETRSAWLAKQQEAKNALLVQRRALEDERSALADKANFSKTILGLLEQAQGASNCVLCGGPADTTALAHLVGGRLTERQQQIEALRAQISGVDDQEEAIAKTVREAEAAWREADRPEQELRQWIATTEAALGRQAQGIEAMRQQVTDQAPARSVEQIEAQLRDLRAKKAAKEANAEAVSQKVQLEARQDLVKRLEKLAKRKAKNFAESAAARAEEVVNLYATDGMEIVYDRKANAWMIGGATRDGRPHSRSASGFERNLMLPALFLAWTHEQPRFCVLDDAVTGTYDAEHLKQLLSVLKGRQEAGDIVQNFVVLPPAIVGHPELDDITAGWTRIDL